MIDYLYYELDWLSLNWFRWHLLSTLSRSWPLLLVLFVVLVVAFVDLILGRGLLLLCVWTLVAIWTRSFDERKLFEVNLEKFFCASLHLPIVSIVCQLLQTCVIPLRDDFADLPSTYNRCNGNDTWSVRFTQIVLLNRQVHKELRVFLDTFQSLLINVHNVPLLVLDLVVWEHNALTNQVLQEMHGS